MKNTEQVEFESMVELSSQITKFVSEEPNQYIAGMSLLIAVAEHSVKNGIPKNIAASILKSLMDDYLKNKIKNMKKVHESK